MKKISFLILFFSLIVSALWSSHGYINMGIEDNPSNASASNPMHAQYEQANSHYKNSENDKAIDITDDIISAAHKAKDYRLEAKAYTLQAKAYYALKNLKKARNKFQSSIDVLSKYNLTDKSLTLENYNYLKLIANANQDLDQVKDLDAKIAQLSGSSTPKPATSAASASTATAPSSSTLSNIKSTVTNVASKVMTSSSADLEKENTARKKMMSEQEKLQKLTKEMEEELKLNASKINEMSAEQLKSKLLLDAKENALMEVQYNDSLNQARIKFQDLAISESESKRNFYIIAMAFLALLLGGSIYLFLKSKKTSKLLEEKNKLIELEKEKSENLLLNILPGNVVQELKEQGYSNARQFENVCVSFLDFVSFSKISEKYDAQIVLDDLNTCFNAFDDILTKYKLEKIKTIGDCYMFAGGLADSDDGQQVPKMVKAAKDMIAWLETWNATRTKKMLITYDARVGLHCGPVAAGVIGNKKFLYDIWGDTVNTAARMEQNSEPNRVNISEEVYKVVKSLEKCTYRGEIAAKNKGLLKMYFVDK